MEKENGVKQSARTRKPTKQKTNLNNNIKLGNFLENDFWTKLIGGGGVQKSFSRTDPKTEESCQDRKSVNLLKHVLFEKDAQ